MEAESNRDGIGLRVKELIHELRMNNNSFSVKIGISATGVASIVNQKFKPRYEFIEKVLNAFPQVSQTWLISGEGPMFITTEPASEVKPKPDAYLMEQLQALEKSWKENLEEKNRHLEEKQQMINQQKFMIETLMSQLNTALGKVDLSKDTLRVSKLIIVKKPTKIIQFARTLANSGTK